jgi:hypothetical protein
MISEEEALQRANQLHPELQKWTPKDFRKAETRDGVNWMLHLQMDAVVLRRESDPSLPDAAVVKELQAKGVTYLDAIHRISRLVVEDIWERVKGPAEASGKSEVSGEAFDKWAAEKNQLLNQEIQRLTQQ